MRSNDCAASRRSPVKRSTSRTAGVNLGKPSRFRVIPGRVDGERGRRRPRRGDASAPEARRRFRPRPGRTVENLDWLPAYGEPAPSRDGRLFHVGAATPFRVPLGPPVRRGPASPPRADWLLSNVYAVPWVTPIPRSGTPAPTAWRRWRAGGIGAFRPRVRLTKGWRVPRTARPRRAAASSFGGRKSSLTPGCRDRRTNRKGAPAAVFSRGPGRGALVFGVQRR